jgi:hypothetical protein
MKLANLTSVLLLLGLTGLTSPGCSGGNPVRADTLRLQIDLGKDAKIGSRTARIAIPLTESMDFPISVSALLPDGSVDTSFNGEVRLAVKPGSVQAVSGPNTTGRNVKLVKGVATNVVVSVRGAFGDARIVGEDLGYFPADPLRKPPPQCSNGIDDDGDGLVDFPADPGCAFGNDDTETGGTYAAGASSTIHFVLPRIADVRGLAQGGGATSFPNQQVQVDTGWNTDDPSKCPKGKFPCFVFDAVVTRIAGDGFYLTDVPAQAATGYASVFAYNFSPPPDMRVCDRLKAFGGTSSDFFGFTEINYPTWELDQWDPNVRPCGVPEPRVLSNFDVGDTVTLLKNTAALVRVASGANLDVHVTSKFGPGTPKCVQDAKTKAWSCVMGDDATNCDINKDGKVDFNNDPEKTCALTCSGDQAKECTEYSDYLGRGNFTLVMKDTNNVTNTIAANGLAANNFDAHALKGKKIGAFTGTLRYFSGGSQFTIEARCDQDVVTDPSKKPLPSDQACVFPRTFNDSNDTSH